MWTKKDMADQWGKTVIVTGANAGIGYETALALYFKGAQVIVAGRDKDKVEKAIADMRLFNGSGTLEAGILDLSRLTSVKEFAEGFKNKHHQLHLLINNAGVMVPPPGKTEEGFELQFGVNFLGHFALTGLLYDLLRRTPKSRVVTVSSLAHKAGSIDFDNLKLEKPYDEWREYRASKLANLLFSIELQKRIKKKGGDILSVAAHPGYTRTELQRNMDAEVVAKVDNFMDASQGALPTLFAAVSPKVKGGDYFGPDGEGEINGFPALAEIAANALNETVAKKLWKYAEEVTGISFP